MVTAREEAGKGGKEEGGEGGQQGKETGGEEKEVEEKVETVTVEKGCQCTDFVEDVYTLSLLESRHCDYMFEVFHNLQFSVEVISPLEIDRPKKSKPIPLTSSTLYPEHRIKLKGTLRDLNSMLADLSLQPKQRSGNMIVPRVKTSRAFSKPVTPLMSRSPGPSRSSATARPLAQLAFLRDLMGPKSRGSLFATTITDPVQLTVMLRMTTTDPFLMQQTRPLPLCYHPMTRQKYQEIEHIQTIMPEVADIRFNISDLVHPEMKADQFFLSSHFVVQKEEVSDGEMLKVDEDVTKVLQLHRFLLKHRTYFRLIFLSYNMEAMSSVNDMLSMNFPTYVKLLKDCLLIHPGFDLLSAAKVFYLSCVKSKELPQKGTPDDERNWFKHLLSSYNFKSNYRLRLPGFIESIVRLVYHHPRFQKLGNLRPYEKLALLYKRSLKPNARVTQGNFYAPLIRDIHVTALLIQFESQLYDIFQGYITRLTAHERISDFIGKSSKMDLHKYYSFLSNAGLLIDAEIVSVGNEEIEEEIDKLNDMQQTDSARKRRTSLKLRHSQPMHAAVKETTIRFPSSMFEKVENKHLKLRAARNLRQTGASRDFLLLPFYRPVRSFLQVDKLTAFSFFVAVMKSINGVFLMNPSLLNDSDFCIDFKEFVDVVGMLGVLYWKTVAKCINMSLVESLASFLKSLVEHFKYMREFRGLSLAEKTHLSMSLLRISTVPLPDLQTKPIITKTMIPQDRFVQRRESI